MNNAANREALKKAVDHALADEWRAAHLIAQEYSDSTACWIHAVLHKIEGDAANSRYWYARTDVRYTDFSDPKQELLEIRRYLDSQS